MEAPPQRLGACNAEIGTHTQHSKTLGNSGSQGQEKRADESSKEGKKTWLLIKKGKGGKKRLTDSTEREMELEGEEKEKEK